MKRASKVAPLTLAIACYLPIATSSTVRSGTLKVVVVSRGKPVRIDGLGVYRG